MKPGILDLDHDLGIDLLNVDIELVVRLALQDLCLDLLRVIAPLTHIPAHLPEPFHRPGGVHKDLEVDETAQPRCVKRMQSLHNDHRGRAEGHRAA